MPKSQINLRLDDDLLKRLDNLAQKTGRTKTFYANEAVVRYLEDIEDYFLAKDSLEAFRNSGDGSLSIGELDWNASNR